MKKQMHFTSYTANFDGDISYTLFLFYPEGVWDEHKRLYNEAVEKYPPNEYKWVKLED